MSRCSSAVLARAGRIIEAGEIIARERKAHLRMRHGETLHDIGDGARLGAIALQEFEPCRRRGEKIAHLDLGAARLRRRRDLVLQALIDFDAHAMRGAVAARRDVEQRDRADRGQRLAAKAERRDREKIAVRQFRRRMALDREIEIFRAHAGAIVGDADQAPAARLDDDLDAACAGIERILDQFLHGGRRTLDDLARRDAVDEDGIETADGHGWAVIVGCEPSRLRRRCRTAVRRMRSGAACKILRRMSHSPA